MDRTHTRQGLFSNEFSGKEKGDGGLLPVWRDYSQFCAARPEVEDGVSRFSLRKENLFGLQLNELSSHSNLIQKSSEIKGHASHLEREGTWTP